MPTISFEQFAERHSITIESATKHARRTDADGWEHDPWTIVLLNPAAAVAGLSGSHFVSYRMGTGHDGQAPAIEDVLSSLALDARSVSDCDDFEEWAREYGYDTDSRKAEAIYHECDQQANELHSWLGDILFAELLECDEEGDEPTVDDIHARFDSEILPLVKEQYEQDGRPDWPARREAFNDWTDGLCKNGEITDWLYENIEHPASCGGDE